MRKSETESNVPEEMACARAHAATAYRSPENSNQWIKYKILRREFSICLRVHHFIMIDVPFRTSFFALYKCLRLVWISTQTLAHGRVKKSLSTSVRRWTITIKHIFEISVGLCMDSAFAPIVLRRCKVFRFGNTHKRLHDTHEGARALFLYLHLCDVQIPNDRNEYFQLLEINKVPHKTICFLAGMKSDQKRVRTNGEKTRMSAANSSTVRWACEMANGRGHQLLLISCSFIYFRLTRILINCP